MTNSLSKTSVGNTLKLYLFPTLVSILAMLIWRDVSELRTDVKALLAQSNVDKTKIDALERDVKSLEQTVYMKKPLASNEEEIQSYDKFFKHEELFDVKKHLNTQNIL